MTDRPRSALDAVVAGAGLAGPARASDLIRAGRRVTLLEASDAVGVLPAGVGVAHRLADCVVSQAAASSRLDAVRREARAGGLHAAVRTVTAALAGDDGEPACTITGIAPVSGRRTG